MDQIPLDTIDGPGAQLETGLLSPVHGPNAHFVDSSGQLLPGNPMEYFWNNMALLVSQPLIHNLKALARRFIQLSCKPEHIASLILDFWSSSLSLIWTAKQSGPDLPYPLSNSQKHKSGRLARLLLEHSRDIKLRNIHVALSPMDGVDPPRVVVINLDEVPQEIAEKGYAVSADFYGFVVMVLFLEIFIALLLHIFSPVDPGPFYDWFSEWVSPQLGHWLGSWSTFWIGLLSTATVQWMNCLHISVTLCVYAVFRGEGTLTLVRRSDISTPSCAVLLDRDFTVVLTGTQSVVEAIAQSSFSISHPYAWREQLEGWQFTQCVWYEVLRAWCQGAPFALLAGFWLLLTPASPLMAFVPLVPTIVVSLARTGADTVRVLIHTIQQQDADFGEFWKTAFIATIRYHASVWPTLLLISMYELEIAKHPIRSLYQPVIFLHWLPLLFLTIHFNTSRNYHIRTAKLLDIIGHPPVRRWEFDTLAAATTFQCLVLCRSIPRPIRNVDVLSLLDTLIPDQTDVWKVWKARVADRIMHEIDISFAPTLPSFGDHRQKRLKELLDQAQIGYGAYTRFFDWHIPLYSTTTL